MCNFCLFLSSLHGTPQMRGGWLMGHHKEELVSMMCYLESSLYNFFHSVSIVCTFCAGGLQCIEGYVFVQISTAEVAKYHGCY